MYLESSDGYTVFTEACNNVDDEKWHPTEKKHAHNDPNGDGGLLNISEKLLLESGTTLIQWSSLHLVFLEQR